MTETSRNLAFGKETEKETRYRPQWGTRHDAVVERYEAKKRDGTVRMTTIVTRDEQSP